MLIRTRFSGNNLILDSDQVKDNRMNAEEAIRIKENLLNVIADIDSFLQKENKDFDDPRLKRAVDSCNGIWPDSLPSGIMFYDGLRITKQIFTRYVKEKGVKQWQKI